MDRIKDFIIGNMPTAVIVFDRRMDIIFSNRQAELFLKYHTLPDEIGTVCRRIFDAINAQRLKDSFPGEIHLLKKLEGSTWSFRVRICEGPEHVVTVFIIEESLSNKVDLNEIRNHFKLTRRETDVLRCALSGLKNTDIADELEISEHTVRDYLSSIFLKIGVESRFALRKKILPDDPLPPYPYIL